MSDYNDVETAARAARYGSMSGTSNSPRPGRTRKLRTSPKGTKLVEQSQDKAILRVKTALRGYWWMPIPIFIVTLPFAIMLGISHGFSTYNWTLVPLISYVAISIFLTIIIRILVHPQINITILPESIRIGEYLFDREHAQGLRIGYTASSSARNLTENFTDVQMGLAGLRMEYGPWGEDLVYMVNKYHAPEICIWVNQITEQVGAPEPAETAPELGRRKQIF